MCWGEKCSRRTVDPVDLPLMLLYWHREFTEALAKWATDVGLEPCKMIERERETHNPEWVGYKMCSHCIMLLLSWKHQSFYLLKPPENDLTAKLLKTLLLLEKLIYVRYLAALLLPFHWVLLSAHWGELSLCGSDEARSLSRSPCGLCISRRQTESWRYELCSQTIIAFSFVLFIFVSMFCLRVAMCERKRGRERNV